MRISAYYELNYQLIIKSIVPLIREFVKHFETQKRNAKLTVCYLDLFLHLWYCVVLTGGVSNEGYHRGIMVWQYIAARG